MDVKRAKAFVFVLMPFDEAFGDIYEVGIKAACRESGAYCERVDEQIFHENILERVYNQIAKADVIIAEMTGRNPNVFYEVGYAHALNKQVILLTQKAEDIPFDLMLYPHVVYEGKIAKLKRELEKRVRWCVENPKRELASVDWELELFVNDVPLNADQASQEVACFRRRVKHVSHGVLNITAHNPGSRVLTGEMFDLALVFPWGARPETGVRNSIAQAGGGLLCSLAKMPPIFPGGWESVRVTFGVDASLQTVPMILRVLNEVGAEDYSFLAAPKVEP